MAQSGIKVQAGNSVISDHYASSTTDGLYINDVKVVGDQEAYVANASVAHALNATFSDTEAEAALNALGTKVNAIFTILKNHGLMASS